MKNYNYFKNSLCILCATFFIILSGCDKAGKSEQNVSFSAQTTYVYITKTGECYHRESCDCLRYSKIERSLTVAARKYRPCKICNPPTMD